MGRGRSLLSANPDNAAPGGATDARCGGGGREGREAGEKQIRAPSNSCSSFSSSSYPLCIRRGFDKKFCFQQCRTIMYEQSILLHSFEHNFRNFTLASYRLTGSKIGS